MNSVTARPAMRAWWMLPLMLAACDAPAEDREAELVSVYARADLSLIRTRPQLSAGKYARMAGAVYDYHRGSLPVFRHDWRSESSVSASAFALASPLVLGTGDPHPENYGVLVAGDDSLAIEPNDFDSADRVPYLWDLRRLLVGLLIAVRASNSDDATQRDAVLSALPDIARATTEGYADTIAERAAGKAPLRITTSLSNPIFADLLARSAGDLADREELDELTDLEGDVRRLKRGGVDPDSPEDALGDLPDNARAALPDVLARYRQSLSAPPPPEYFHVLDAVRRYGQGVASFPRVRLLILVRGPSDAPDDDVILEARELIDSGVAGWRPPGVHYDSPAERILLTSRAAWARPDAAPLWGVSELFGLQLQIRWETEGQKTFRARRLVEDLGTPTAIADFGRRLAGLAARIHATPTEDAPEPAAAVQAVIVTDRARFIDEQVEFALRYSERVAEDFDHFRHALQRWGPRLGVPAADGDLPSPDLAALFGTPPTP